MAKCLACGGRGWTSSRVGIEAFQVDSTPTKCSACNGTGTVPDISPPDFDWSIDPTTSFIDSTSRKSQEEAKCWVCGGSGYSLGNRCLTCGGTGKR